MSHKRVVEYFWFGTVKSVEQDDRAVVVHQSPAPGCICPPTSERTCQNPLCARRSLAANVGPGLYEQGPARSGRWAP